MDRENTRENVRREAKEQENLAEGSAGKPRSGSRYADKQEKDLKSGGSRYADKQEKDVKSGRSRYADKQEKDLKSGGSRYADRQEKDIRSGGSRYADKQEKDLKSSGSRYADKQEKSPEKTGGKYRTEKKAAQKETENKQSVSESRAGKDPSDADADLPEEVLTPGSQGSSADRQESGRNGPDREADKPENIPERTGGSRYADKRTGGEEKTSGSRYADKHGEDVPGQKKPSFRAGKESGAENKREGIRKDPVKTAFLCLAAAAVIAYAAVAFYFSGHFYPGSEIYGIDCSRATVQEAKDAVKEKIAGYVLTVNERQEKTDTIKAAQIDLTYADQNGIEQKMKRQRSYFWPVMMLFGNSGEAEISTVYDRDGIDAVLQQLNCFLPGNSIAPQDAYRLDSGNRYEVAPEVMGTTLDYEKTKAVIVEALDSGKSSVSLEDSGCYIDPLIYRDDPELNAEVEELNSLLTACVTYDFADRQEVVDGSVIKQWIVKGESGEYCIDEDRIREYVAELAAKYDTFGGVRTFTTSIGTVETLSGGDYGWCIDQDATAQILTEAVKEGKTETIEPVYLYTAMSRETDDIGGTYVEICISRQEMWCYQDGVLLVDTPVVTGNPNRDNATPSGGVWAIDAKMRDYTLRGEGYAAPVDFWMPFNEDVGIHDMQNRAYFGGTIYLSNGSHGCVNTPYEEARTIYGIVSIGTPVVVYE